MNSAVSKWIPVVTGLMAAPVIVLAWVPADFLDFRICRVCTPNGQICEYRICRAGQKCSGQTGTTPDGKPWVEALCIDLEEVSPDE